MQETVRQMWMRQMQETVRQMWMRQNAGNCEINVDETKCRKL